MQTAPFRIYMTIFICTIVIVSKVICHMKNGCYTKLVESCRRTQAAPVLFRSIHATGH